MFRLASRPPSSPRCRRGYEASSFAGPPWMRRCGQSSAKQGSGRRRHLAGGGSPTCPPDAAGERPRTMRRALSRGHRYRGGPRVRPRRGSLRQGCPLRRGSPGQARSPEPLPWRAYRGATRQTAPRDSASGSWPARRDSGPPSCTTSLAGSGSSSHRTTPSSSWASSPSNGEPRLVSDEQPHEPGSQLHVRPCLFGRGRSPLCHPTLVRSLRLSRLRVPLRASLCLAPTAATVNN